MISKEQHQKELNKVKRSYENILIDIIFQLMDIEEEIENNSFPIEEITEKIEEIKKKIGYHLKD